MDISKRLRNRVDHLELVTMLQRDQITTLENSLREQQQDATLTILALIDIAKQERLHEEDVMLIQGILAEMQNHYNESEYD